MGVGSALLALVLLLAACALGAGRAEAIALHDQIGAACRAPASGTESGLALGDLDEDGDLDLAVSLQSGDLSVLLRGADGGYAQAPSFPRSLGSSYAGPMRAVDLDGDGHLDLVALQIRDATSYAVVLLGDGAGGFGTAASIPLTGTPGTMAVADVTGDGRPDLVLPSYLPSDTRLLVMPGDGAGGFGAPLASQPLLDGSDPAAIVLADLDHDGDLDAAVAHVFTAVGIVTVLAQRRRGRFRRESPAARSTSARRRSRWPGGDVDGDGALDLVAPVRPASRDNRTITAGVLLGGDGGGCWLRRRPGRLVRDAAGAQPGLAVRLPARRPRRRRPASTARSRPTRAASGRCSATAAAASCSEPRPRRCRPARSSTAGTIADVDGDGVLDVVVTSASSPARVFLLINDAEPAISVAGALDLGSAQVGAAPATAAVRIANPGDHGLRVTGLSLAGADAADFARRRVRAGCLAAPIPAGAFCDATVTFTPHAAGPRAATLEIASTAPGAR